MLKNYFKTALRALLRQKFYSVINIAGLSIGISACILVGLYIKQDLSYDSYNKNAGQIFRIGFSSTQTGTTQYSAQTPALLGPALKNISPEIKKITRIYFSTNDLIEAGNNRFYESELAYADPAFFEMFTFKSISGNQNQFLKEPNTIVLTETSAKKYFGENNPLGQLLKINNEFIFKVVGVIEDVPANSHFKFDFLASYSSLDKQPEANYINQWGARFGSYTYILVQPGFNQSAFVKKNKDFFKTYANIQNNDWQITVIPMPDIHLYSHLPDEIEENSSVARILIIGSIALFILLLACINFVNLATARASKRTTEIGIRKVLGAFRLQLIKQFLSESILLAFISLLLSFAALFILKPFLSTLAGMEIEYNIAENWVSLFFIVSGVLLVGILAGLYPALFLSSYQPVKAIKGSSSFGSGKTGAAHLRKGLVVLQFTISVILISSTLIANLQLGFMQNYNMGFNKNHIITIPAHQRIGNKYETIKNELRRIPGVIDAVAGVGAPVNDNCFETECKPGGVTSREGFEIQVHSVDYDYMKMFGVKLVAGRFFSKDYSTDFPGAMVINEKMAENLGFKNSQDALGKNYFISLNGYKPQIIGVIKDFNSKSLHNEIMPQVFMINPRWFSEFDVKVNSENIASTISDLKKVMISFYPDYPFEFHFLDETIDKLYNSEAKYSEIITAFSAIALFIACLGLLGLTSYITERRKKEIGIRKVHGASIGNIISKISGEFAVLILLSNIVAWPVAYYFLNKWLQDFAYRIEINLWVFMVSGGIVLMVAIAAISYQAIKAATANPIESLRYE